jgi:hypothetical protein
VLRARGSASTGRRVRLSYPVSHIVLDRCCSGDTAYLLLQINIICLLLALIGSAAIIKHPAWLGGVPASAAQTIAER